MPRRFLLPAMLLLSSCGPRAYRVASEADTVESYRRFLRENPRDDQVDAARARLGELEFDEASRIHSVVAYKRFLAEFGDSDRAVTARKLLEGLRFNVARDRGTVPSLRQFLADHPEGAHREEAQVLLAKLESADLGALDDPEALERIAREHVDDLQGASAAARLDDRAFADALSGGAELLYNYLRERPAGAHREEVKLRLLSLTVDGLLFSGLLDEAKALTSRNPLSPGLADLPARFQKAAQERQALRSAHAGPCTVEHYLRLAPDLVAALGAPDPLDRWQAAEELGQHVSVQVIDPLLASFRTSRNPLIRHHAFESLGGVLRALPRPVAEREIFGRLESLRETSASPETGLVVAALLDLGGRLDQAAIEYQRVFRSDSPDPFVLARWTQLRLERREYHSAAVAARQLSLWAKAAAVEEEIPTNRAIPLGSARQLCAVHQAAMLARDAIERAGRQPMAFPEDLQEFARRAEEAASLSAAKLRDAELSLKEGDLRARTCADTAVRERIDAGEQERLRALAEIRTRDPKAALALLERARSKDPSPAVRKGAALLLEQGTR